jgi:hypothetical protein
MTDYYEDLREKFNRLKEGVDYINKGGENHDPKDTDPKYREIMRKAGREADESLARDCPGLKGKIGYCHAYWGEKKRILKEKYALDWHSPVGNKGE